LSYSTAKPLVSTGIFIALVIIFTHIFAIQTPFVRISFGFLPIALFAALFGPLRAALMAAAADLFGCLIFSPGLFFPGFTCSAALSGLVYGYFFYKKEITIKRSVMACGLVFLAIDLGLNTLWLVLLYQKAASAFFLSRLLKSALLFPAHVSLIFMLSKPLGVFLPRHSSR